MNTILWIGLVMIIIYIIHLIYIRVTNDSLEDVKFTNLIATTITVFIACGVLMWLSGLVNEYEINIETQKRYDTAILNNTWKIKTTHELILSEEGDTIEYEMKREVVIPPKIKEE